MVDIGDLVGFSDDLPLKRFRKTAVAAVPQNSHSYLIGQVQPLPVFLQKIHNTQRLLVMTKRFSRHLRQRNLSRMTKGRMAEIVAKRNGLRQILVQSQCSCDRTRNSRHLQRMRHPRAVVVALRLQKHLRFVHQAAERFTM